MRSMDSSWVPWLDISLSQDPVGDLVEVESMGQKPTVMAIYQL